MEEKQIIIKNNFFDFIFLFFGFIVSGFKSLLLLFNFTKKRKLNNIFFEVLDFIFRIWPTYFWKNPTGYKLTSFIGNLFKYIFDRKITHEK